MILAPSPPLADRSARPASLFTRRTLGLAPLLGAALVGTACGSDPDPPAPPAELGLSAQPSEGWCCPGEASSTEPGGPLCRVVATRFRDDPDNADSFKQHLVSLTASAIDTRTGTLVSIVPPGRCVGISGLCGHFVVTVNPDASPAPAEQIFGLERFELVVADDPAATINVRIRLRDDTGQFLLAPSGEPLQTDLALDVSFIESVLDQATGVITCPALG